jgi:hypothetical protein
LSEAFTNGLALLLSDKNGKELIWNGDAQSFGLNHAGKGGNVLRLNGAVEWHTRDEWADVTTGGGRARILGGLILQEGRRQPSNLVDH